jgi:Tfp pilus assembly protein PilN
MYALFTMKMGASVAEEASIQMRIKKLKPLLKEIELAKREESELNPRVSTLEDAQKLTSRWGRLLEHLTVNTPPDGYYTTIRSVASDPKKPIEVTFNGVCSSQATVSEMVMRTQNSRDLEAVNLEGSREKPIDKLSAIEFTIRGNITDSAEVKEEKEEKKS